MTAEPEIDFTQIAFPSDKLTIKMLRRVWPYMTDIERESSYDYAPNRRYVRQSLDSVIGESLIDLERLLAERAFKVALGQSIKDDTRLFSRYELIDSLVDVYIKCGLAQGEHEVEETVRRFEEQAEAQARQHLGRPR